MASLKAFLPHMAKVLGTTADALYSRQRALVDLGVLRAVAGRGPGSGTPLNGAGVASLIIALLAADTLQDTDERVRLLCNAKPRDAEKCPWTAEANFQSALAAVLVSKEMSRSLAFLSVYRHHNRAQIGYGRPDQSFGSMFQAKTLRKQQPIIRISANIEINKLKILAGMLQAENGGMK
jgi:hypothetical protein